MLATRFSVRAPNEQSVPYRWVVDETTKPPGLKAVPVVGRKGFDPPAPHEKQIVHVRPSIRGIAHDVARKHGVTVADIFMGSRQRKHVRARQEVMWEGRQAGWSFPMIARRFPSEISTRAHMDHTSIIHGVRQHAKIRRLEKLAAVKNENEASARIHGGRS